jgi:hypothetical protein
MIAKGRRFAGVRKGIKNPKAKLTESDIAIIRASTKTNVEIARQFNIHPTHVGDILKGKYWNSIGGI